MCFACHDNGGTIALLAISSSLCPSIVWYAQASAQREGPSQWTPKRISGTSDSCSSDGSYER